MIDNSQSFEIPEGIRLNLDLVGPIPRAAAWVLDTVFITIANSVASLALSLLGEMGAGVYYIFIFFTYWFYFIVFEATKGATPGKMIFNLSVVHDDGTPLSWSSSFIRNLIRVVDFMPLFYGFGLISIMSNSKFKRLGDIAAGSIAIYVDNTTRFLNIPQKEPLPLPKPLTLEEQKAILEFAERTSVLSTARQEELAQLLKDFEVNSKHTPNAQRLIQYANWIKMGGAQ